MTQRQPATGGDTSLNYSFAEYAMYVNDSWNVSPRLTLSLGLRYDLVPPPYSVDHFWAALDASYPGYRLVMPGITQGWSSQPYSAQKRGFRPAHWAGLPAGKQHRDPQRLWHVLRDGTPQLV